ncbi:MAG: SGNH/GDSL hydrolase family protein [Burkholderiaceae bacterium]|nr:SGNH/GDSL hydrolase family protein [Burkholderiaceae bacterium]
MIRVAAKLALGPLLLWQAQRVRRTTPRLPVAGGALAGEIGTGARLRLLVVGESTAVGVGAAHHGEALAGELAGRIAAKVGRRVAWRVLGENGATARRTLRLVEATHAEADLAVVALGVNDVLEQTRLARWRRDVAALVAALQERTGARDVILLEVPPLAKFPALPRPLRDVLGADSRRLDAVLARLAARLDAPDRRVRHYRFAFDGAREFFARDGFHPSALGYARWTELIASRFAQESAGESTD